MIIESAFYKLPELLFGSNEEIGTGKIREAMLVNYFTTSIMAELNARNVPDAMRRIVVEQKYLNHSSYSCDIYFDSAGLYTGIDIGRLMLYNRNYIEAKCFTKATVASNTSQARTINSAIILNDILRLLKYGEPNQGAYFLIFFDRKKDYYITQKRKWLYNLFLPGLKYIDIDISGECKSFIESLQVKDVKNQFRICVCVYEIIGLHDSDGSAYLVKILQ